MAGRYQLPRYASSGDNPLTAGAGELPLLEALLAEHRTPLRGPERHRGVLTTRRTLGLCFHPARHRGPGTYPVGPFGLARLAALRLVLELLVGEKELLTGRPD